MEEAGASLSLNGKPLKLSSESPAQTLVPVQATTSFSLPQSLDTSGNLSENCKLWLQTWKSYAFVTRLNTQPAEEQTHHFLLAVGPSALKIYNGFEFASEAEKTNLTVIIKKFHDHAILRLSRSSVSSKRSFAKL